MRLERLGAGGRPAEVLRALHARARRLSLPAPAALVGRWFDAAAVIAPHLQAQPVAPRTAFASSAADRPTTGGDPVIGGGWIGYLAYPDGVGRLPSAAGGWTDSVLRLDADGCWWYESLTDACCPPDVAAAALDPQSEPRAWSMRWTPPDRGSHHDNVEACKDAIRAGEVYQSCICTQFTGQITGRPADFFADGIDQTQPTRAAYLQGPWGAVASLSPELYVARHGTTVTSSPIKGTLPLTADPAALRVSAKDVAENVMIVDLVRNDLGRLAVTGTVTVTDLLRVRPAPGVWHLVSTVQAQIPPTTTAAELFEASFPPASVTGCPKTRARQLISDWEPQPRGVYCGTVGMSSPLAGLELNVAIRTVEFTPTGGAVLGVGGGITIDSDPAAEWQECLDKARSIIELTPTQAPALIERP
ncbi:aminodeoxychorismate synthase component I [Rhodococcus aetherivorans]|uniref:aminodeoxychorismate synthase component I n=1 Tax=Rhodococcus aetherivorans TaxID=191292 RepID=UPI0036B6D6C3